MQSIKVNQYQVDLSEGLMTMRLSEDAKAC